MVRWPAPEVGALINEAAPGNARRRLGIAVAVSAVLHGMVVFSVRAGRGEGSVGGQFIVLTARLAPLHSAEFQPPAMATLQGADPVPAISRPEPQSARPAPSAESRPEASGALPLDFIRKNQYYLASRLHPQPRVLGDIPFEYPRDSALREGIVNAKVLINDKGGVDDVIVETSEPAGIFDAVTVQSLLNTRFSPGMLHNSPVASQLLLEVRYQDPGSSTMPGISVSVKGRSP